MREMVVRSTMEGMTRRAPRDIAYCAISAAYGLAGLALVLFWLAPSVWLSVTVLGTAAGLLLTMGGLRAARVLASLQRRTLARFAGVTVDPPPPFEPGSGLLGRLEKRLKDQAAWRAVGYLAARLPLAVLQAWVVAFASCGVADFSYPLIWRFVHPHRPSPLPVRVVTPVPFGGLAISTWPGAFLASLIGLGFVAVAVLLARPAVFADAWLARTLLGPGALTQRVRELERTRSLAVDSAAAALRRVERDLHDGAQVRLTALAMNLGMAREKASADEPDLAEIRELLAGAHADARGALSELRDLARGIHPPVLDNGLPEALASLAAASAIPVTVSVSGLGEADGLRRPSPAIETIVYFCAAELVANAVKHSFANEVSVAAAAGPRGVLVMSVTDDGVGGADPAHGSGLTGLIERVAVVDGVLRISSPPGGPTVVTAELPMEA
jgi:signal transduction histidine kinase